VLGRGAQVLHVHLTMKLSRSRIHISECEDDLTGGSIKGKEKVKDEPKTMNSPL
jgi:hypothetical protein